MQPTFQDIFSRKIVAWQVYEEEISALAGDVLHDLCRREGILPGQLILHSDNGSPMKGATIPKSAGTSAVKPATTGRDAFLQQAVSQQRQPLLGILIQGPKISS